MLYKLSSYQSISGWHVICNDLVGKGEHGCWNYPALVMDLPVREFVRRLAVEWNAEIVPFYNENGTLSWLSYRWKSEEDANKFKNGINFLARKTNFQI